MQSSKIKISEVYPCEEDSEMWEAHISLPNHSEAITVFGMDLDECLTRAVIVRNAFRDVNYK